MDNLTSSPLHQEYHSPNNITNTGVLNNGPGSVFILVFFSIQGTLGNIVIMIAVAVEKKLGSYTDVFVVNVACMDFIITGVIIPSMVPLLLASQNIYCHEVYQAFRLMAVLLCIGSIVSLTVVVVNRYISIGHQPVYNRIFSKVKVSMTICGI